MKRVLLALALVGLGAGVVYATPNDLSNGVLITHYPPGLQYTTEFDDWCGLYGQYAIQSCEQQNNVIDTQLGTVWYVLAAWNDNDKVWCGTEFGLGNYNTRVVLFADYGQCPGTALTIPYGAWPAPNTGMSLAATSEPWAGNFQPVYFFASYAYPAQGSTVVPLTPHPNTGFAGFANCLTPPGSYPAVGLGAMGFFTGGVYACPPLPSQFVCCVGEECFLVYNEQECTEMGGVWHPEWDSCLPDNPCFVPPVPAVCCVGHTCYLVFEEECIAMEGNWHPEWPSCDDNPCDIYTPVEPSSWGAIKAIYR